jgi:hypothetical protein
VSGLATIQAGSAPRSSSAGEQIRRYAESASPASSRNTVYFDALVFSGAFDGFCGWQPGSGSPPGSAKGDQREQRVDRAEGDGGSGASEWAGLRPHLRVAEGAGDVDRRAQVKGLVSRGATRAAMLRLSLPRFALPSTLTTVSLASITKVEIFAVPFLTGKIDHRAAERQVALFAQHHESLGGVQAEHLDDERVRRAALSGEEDAAVGRAQQLRHCRTRPCGSTR